MENIEDKPNSASTLRAPTSSAAPRTPSPSRSPLSKEFDRPSGLGRVFNPPKLEKKHSSGDLISRLKTRKILGVGETDNGDIHRSKISQVLGHNEHLFVRLPKGFWLAHALIAGFVALEAGLFIISPSVARSITLVTLEQDDNLAASRITGAVLCGMAVFVCSLIGTADKYYAKVVLLSVLTYHVLCSVLCAGSIIGQGNFGGRWLKAALFIRIMISSSCLWYLNQISTFSPCRGIRPHNNWGSNSGQKEN